MDFKSYCREGHDLYEKFGELITQILAQSMISDTPELKYWQIQSRAKSSQSLKEKLVSRGLKDIENIETEIKDLAGCRVIFYSNGQVNEFIQSGLLNQNFEIDWNNLKIHQPLDEHPNIDSLYRAHHYIISLKKNRAVLPEYAKFAGLRCELQIQTILNHAWSETGHDIVYKTSEAIGFGTKELEQIKARMSKIMQEYLIPAGYEFQKVLNDYKRLSTGKLLFERNVFESVNTSSNNNERFELLEQIRDHVIPNYDDPVAEAEGIFKLVMSVIKAARIAPAEKIITPFGDYEGKKSHEVIKVAYEILRFVMYVEPQNVFLRVCELYISSASSEESEETLKFIKKLATHNLSIWEKHGPVIPDLLSNELVRFDDNQLKQYVPIILEVSKALLGVQIEGHTNDYNTVTIRTANVPSDDVLATSRANVIDTLFRIYRLSNSNKDKKALIGVLSFGFRFPIRGNSDGQLEMVLQSSQKIFQFYLDLAATEDFEISQKLEVEALHHFRRCKQWALSETASTAVKEAASNLASVLNHYKVVLNLNERYVHFKTLVGYDSVFQDQWGKITFEFDYTERNEARAKQIGGYVSSITEENSSDWCELIIYCSKVDDSDLATLTSLNLFIEKFAEVRPEIAFNILNSYTTELGKFIPSFLVGFWKSSFQDQAKALVQEWISNQKYLQEIAFFYSINSIYDEPSLSSILDSAITARNPIAIIDVISACINLKENERVKEFMGVFDKAFDYLTQAKDTRWINRRWFRVSQSPLFKSLKRRQYHKILKNMIYCQNIGTNEEEILAVISDKFPSDVIHFFGSRIRYKSDLKEDPLEYKSRYEDVPYEFYSLAEKLNGIAETTVRIVRAWYSVHETSMPHSEWFNYTGAKVLANIYPKFSKEIETELINLVASGNKQDTDFVISILRNYHGDPSIHETCKAIIESLETEETERVTKLHNILDSMGVVSGEFGSSEGYKRKKHEIQTWLTDERVKVIKFAQGYIASLDTQIASNRYREEQRLELGKLQYSKN